ncbi:uncharacterized protein B0H18DRAFT_306825 [Fomitopsis serialis]|uniref:uncharacterized protein n=1 Tax=Fomitopsis serialis TaxID=139415 RepID=UPI0020082E36|nr:uncharacterized protein B0H18DRAFT_306825 [Neoantrodia serialis]KAH9927012.1 hypothetical protein B0H18DRAFT_306825 [Neoantrodia serialis]
MTGRPTPGQRHYLVRIRALPLTGIIFLAVSTAPAHEEREQRDSRHIAGHSTHRRPPLLVRPPPSTAGMSSIYLPTVPRPHARRYSPYVYHWRSVEER